MNDVLTVCDLHVTFHTQRARVHAVRGVDFSIREEETLAIVGESGCGKSALAKALVQLLPSSTSTIAGQICYKGIDLLTLSEKKRRHVRGKEIGMVFQDPLSALNPTLKVGAQISEALLCHFPHLTRREKQEKAIDILKQVGIDRASERYFCYPHQLSGGQRQRALIALALACHPTLLIADEITTALDATLQAEILALLAERKRTLRMSLLFITHDLNLVARFCDRVLVMYAGKIVEEAPVHMLFARPQHPYTQGLLRTVPRLDHPKNLPLIPIPGTPPSLSAPLPGCSFCARCTSAMRICAEQTPLRTERGAHHYTRCFLYDEGRQK